MAPREYPCRVLEINVISAQDLAPVSKSMKTYAVACVSTNPMRKLTTRVDQVNRANPIWNEKFVFRLDSKNKVPNLEESAIMIEIYTAAWAKDALVGTVTVLLSDLFSPWSGFDDGFDGNKNMRLVSLQVRRPSGRHQGILRLGVAMLDGTQRSMPLSVGTSKKTTAGLNEGVFAKNTDASPKSALLRRTHSDHTESTATTTMAADDYIARPAVTDTGSGRKGGGGGGTDSMVNGSLCNSDIGPSASVVAAAIANGLASRNTKRDDPASSIVEGATEGMQAKLDRWRREASAASSRRDKKKYRKMGSSLTEVDNFGDRSRARRYRRSRRRRLFSCFGNLFGCEISITCGGGGDSSDKRRNASSKVCNLSSADGTYCSRAKG